jgi:flagellar basal body L-ring protein FlgH
VRNERDLNGKFIWLCSTFTVLGLVSGCSELMGVLRPDFSDTTQAEQSKPTVGGRWSERGFLNDDMPVGGSGYNNVGHSERAPASGPASYNAAYHDDSWVDRDRASANRRDQSRGAEGEGPEGADGQAYANTPNQPPATKRQYKNGTRATSADFVDESQNEGSLWGSDGQTNYYFTKNKVRGVGDIITITMEDGLLKDAGTEVKHTLTDNEKEAEIALAQNRANARAGGDKNKDAVSSSQAAPAADGTAATPAGGNAQVTPADIDIAKSLELKPGDAMMAEIVERYPNGNYKISGSKRVNYKNGSPRLLNLVGVVRGPDIGDDDTVASGKLYEYRLEAIR